jgi:hypothetical protein
MVKQVKGRPVDRVTSHYAFHFDPSCPPPMQKQRLDEKPSSAGAQTVFQG